MNHDEEQVLLCAGRIADLSLRLVGGRGLNGYIAAVGIDGFSDVVKELETELLNCASVALDLNCGILNNITMRHLYEMANCATIFCAQEMTLKKFSQLAKELRSSVEKYNDYIFNKIKAES
jgi:hypothetical protein